MFYVLSSKDSFLIKKKNHTVYIHDHNVFISCALDNFCTQIYLFLGHKKCISFVAADSL